MEIGTDIAKISDFSGKDDYFYRRILHDEEYKVFSSLSDIKRKTEYAAGRWAAKEAIFKATQDPSYLHYAVLNDKSGKPYVRGRTDIRISLSHSGDYVVAFVLVL